METIYDKSLCMTPCITTRNKKEINVKKHLSPNLLE